MNRLVDVLIFVTIATLVAIPQVALHLAGSWP